MRLHHATIHGRRAEGLRRRLLQAVHRVQALLPVDRHVVWILHLKK